MKFNGVTVTDDGINTVIQGIKGDTGDKGEKGEKCDKLFDVDMKDFDSVEEDLKRKIKNDNGFTFTGCDIIFKGICPECKKSSKI